MDAEMRGCACLGSSLGRAKAPPRKEPKPWQTPETMCSHAGAVKKARAGFGEPGPAAHPIRKSALHSAHSLYRSELSRKKLPRYPGPKHTQRFSTSSTTCLVVAFQGGTTATSGSFTVGRIQPERPVTIERGRLPLCRMSGGVSG